MRSDPHQPFVACATLAAVVVSSCDDGHAPTPAHHAHETHSAHGPLVHRFDNAEEWAKRFDDPARDAWQRPSDVVAAMEIAPGMTVADVGAGTGYFAPWLSRAVGETGVVLALDAETDMVRYLNERVAREGLRNVRPGLVAFDDPKLPPAEIDRVLIVDTWHHVSQRELYAKKLAAGLKPGGRVIVVDFTREAKHGPPVNMRVAPDAVARELESAGLSARIAATPLPDQFVVVATRP